MHYLLAEMSTGAIVAIVVLAVLVLWAISVFNTLVRKRNEYKNAFAQIDVQLRRRYDLIPNLVNCVKGYMAHERETLEAVVKARNQAAAAVEAASKMPGDANAMAGLSAAENQLHGALGRLLVTVERYPDLKANQNMLELQEELTSTENKVSFARQAYNDAVTDYNNTRAVFPANMIAGSFGFTEAKLLEVEEAVREAPKVQF